MSEILKPIEMRVRCLRLFLLRCSWAVELTVFTGYVAVSLT